MDTDRTKHMHYHIDIQHADHKMATPISDDLLRHWAITALTPYRETAELTLRLVDVDEMTHLNHTYRKQPKQTNVLAFPATHPKELMLDYPLLGDVILCPAVLQAESVSLKTPLNAHWAHIVIHGVLHLLGYDHLQEEEAHIMQTIEQTLLIKLGFEMIL